MREEWTGEVVGKMHVAGITNDDLAKEMCCNKSYVSMILNGVRTPRNGRERIEAALERCIARQSA